MDGDRLEQFGRQHCLRLLADNRVGRVAATSGGLPVIWPVAYRCVGEDIFFVAPEDPEATHALDQAIIAFQTDRRSAGRLGWIVQAVGRATVTDEPARVRQARAAGLPGADTGPLVVLSADILTGHPLHPASPSAADGPKVPTSPPPGTVIG